jgi:hypothetical protein
MHDTRLRRYLVLLLSVLAAMFLLAPKAKEEMQEGRQHEKAGRLFQSPARPYGSESQRICPLERTRSESECCSGQFPISTMLERKIRFQGAVPGFGRGSLLNYAPYGPNGLIRADPNGKPVRQ